MIRIRTIPAALCIGLLAASLPAAPAFAHSDRDRSERVDDDDVRKDKPGRKRKGDDERAKTRRVGEDVGADGVKRRGDGSVDDDRAVSAGNDDRDANGVKRRGDGTVDDNSPRR